MTKHAPYQPSRAIGQSAAGGRTVHVMDLHQAVLIAQEARYGRPMPCMEGYGTRIQYSVFVCDLSGREMILMRGDVEALMKNPKTA